MTPRALSILLHYYDKQTNSSDWPAKFPDTELSWLLSSGLLMQREVAPDDVFSGALVEISSSGLECVKAALNACETYKPVN